ncbi:MAG: hypothetical protein LBJ08_07595, partial [Bifidobacteriaceae bacterium]|nr:hypothetical protein [Bifidobacteriaceae bacterium]
MAIPLRPGLTRSCWRRRTSVLALIAASTLAPQGAPGLALADPPTLPRFDPVTGIALNVFTDRSTWLFTQAWVEVPQVDTDGDGLSDLIHVDYTRPAETETEDLDVPVILAMSPYYAGVTSVQNHTVFTEVGEEPIYGDPPYTLTGKNNTRLERTAGSGNNAYTYAISAANILDYVPKGFAVAHAETLGSGWSQGCPTAGDQREQAAAKAAVEWFAGYGTAYTDESRTQVVSAASWSAGKVGMLGTSYEGTLPIMAAAAGARGLKAIMPDSAIGSWYEYYRANGTYRAPGGYPGEDTDIHAKFNYSSMAYSHSADPAICQPIFTALENAQDRASGNMSAFWEERDYTGTVPNWDTAVFIEAGFRDWNVMAQHSARLIEALKANNKNWQAWFHQQGHGHSHPTPEIRNAFFTHYLYGGAPSGGEQRVYLYPSTPLEQSTTNWAAVEPEEFDTWPVPGTQAVTLNLAPATGVEPGSLTFDTKAGIGAVQSFTDETAGYGNSVPAYASGLPSDQVYTPLND